MQGKMRWRAAVVRGLASTVLVTIGAVVFGGATGSAAPNPRASGLHGVNILGTGLSNPASISADGIHLWITNTYAGTLTELNETTGAVVRVIDVSLAFQSFPYGVAADGTHVWVIDDAGAYADEFSASNGALVRRITLPDPGSCDHIDLYCAAAAISSDGTHVWITEMQTDTLTELSAATGAVVETFQGPAVVLSDPTSVASDGNHVWITDGHDRIVELSSQSGALVKTVQIPNGAGSESAASDGSHVWVLGNSSVTELSAATGSVVRQTTLNHSPVANYPAGIFSDGTHVWVACNDAIDELSTGTGALVRTLAGARLELAGAIGVVSNGTRVWVVNGTTGSLTELSAVTGRLASPPSIKELNLQGAAWVASDGSHVWTADTSTNAVTELSANTGRQLRLIRGTLLGNGIQVPSQILVDGTHVWILNQQGVDQGVGYSVTELDEATGRFVRNFTVAPFNNNRSFVASFILSGGHLWVLHNDHAILEYSTASGTLEHSYPGSRLDLPRGITGVGSGGAHLWLTGPHRLVEVSPISGKVLRVFPGASIGAQTTTSNAVVAVGQQVWVQWDGGTALAEYSSATGAVMRILPLSSLGLASGPIAFADSRGHIWVLGNAAAKFRSDAVVELSSATGGVLHRFSGPMFGFSSPQSIAVDAAHVWVTDVDDNSMTEWAH